VPHIPAVVQTVAGLSALTRLHLTSSITRSSRGPRCKELACLHSTSLKELSVELDQVSNALVPHRM